MRDLTLAVRPRAATTMVVLALGLCTLAACAPKPRIRAVEGGPVATGAGTLEDVRGRLMGKWALVSFDTVDAAGASTRIDAKATMTYDQFGNLATIGELTDATRKALGDRAALLDAKGRAVIDPAKQEIRILDVELERPIESSKTLEAIAPNKVRAYAFEGDLLALTVKDAAGKPTAKLTWKKIE